MTPPPTESGFYGISFNTKDRTTRNFSQKELEKELKDPNVFSWIDIQAPDISSLNDVLRSLGIDLVLVGYFDQPEVLPRIVERPDCLAFYLYEVFKPEHHLDTTHGLSEIDVGRIIMVLATDYIITYHRRALDVVDYVKQGCQESFRLAGKTPGFIAFLFMQQCLYDYAHLNLANDNYLDSLEAGVLTGHEELSERISIAGLNILTLKKITASLHIILMLICTKKSIFISDEGRESFREMLQNATSIRAAIDSSRDLLDGILNSIQASAVTKTSEIARVLTVVSAIILPLSLVAGIYGMNFEYMPEIKHPAGYFLVLGFMASLSIALLLLFIRLGWIGKKKK
jgi:magnesium/cobalt transport protein CorA